MNTHTKMGLGAKDSFTTLRFLYYPPLPPTMDLKPGQLRCGEHVDYGSLTLLFQDPHGGLQVRSHGSIDRSIYRDLCLGTQLSSGEIGHIVISIWLPW